MRSFSSSIMIIIMWILSFFFPDPLQWNMQGAHNNDYCDFTEHLCHTPHFKLFLSSWVSLLQFLVLCITGSLHERRWWYSVCMDSWQMCWRCKYSSVFHSDSVTNNQVVKLLLWWWWCWWWWQQVTTTFHHLPCLQGTFTGSHAVYAKELRASTHCDIVELSQVAYDNFGYPRSKLTICL